jgi:hypothetical protein
VPGASGTRTHHGDLVRGSGQPRTTSPNSSRSRPFSEDWSSGRLSVRNSWRAKIAWSLLPSRRWCRPRQSAADSGAWRRERRRRGTGSRSRRDRLGAVRPETAGSQHLLFARPSPALRQRCPGARRPLPRHKSPRNGRRRPIRGGGGRGFSRSPHTRQNAPWPQQ